MRGFKQADIYPLKGANPTLAKQVSGGDSSNLTILHTTSATSIARAQVLQFNLTQAGLQGDAEAAAVRGCDQDGGHEVAGAGW